jgi:subtilisin family serine protease
MFWSGPKRWPWVKDGMRWLPVAPLTLLLGMEIPAGPARSFSPPSVHPGSAFSPVALRTSDLGRTRLNQWWSDIPRDSTTHVQWHGTKAVLSYDFLHHLARQRGWQKPFSDIRTHRDRWGQDLRAQTGVPLTLGSPMHALYVPNDKWFQGSPQWALSNPGTTISEIPGIPGYDIRMPEVWDQWGGSDSMLVAVIDAGFHFKHPDLQDRWFVNSAEAKGRAGVDDDANGFIDDSVGWDFVESDNDPKDGNGHGTEVASIIAAAFDNGLGISGMLPEARVLPIRVLDASGHGDLADIAAGIRYAVDMGATVINFSIGGASNSGELKSAFQAARDRGIPIVVAAGNEGMDLDALPPAPFNYGFENVIGVAAVNHGGRFCKFSNYGKKTIDLAAPGEFVLTCGAGERVEIFKDDFESETLKWSMTNPGDFRLTATNPIEEKQSLEWVSTSNTTLTLNDTVDLRGKYGGSIWFQTEFTPSNSSDGLVLEALVIGESRWQTMGAVGGEKLDQGFSFGLTHLDGTRFRLRFRTSVTGSSLSRKLKLDFVYLSSLNPNPADPESYPVVAGTSIAAPHVSAYVALLRVACQRMGIPFTKELVRAGTVPDTACANRTISGGRLDVAKGLAFYLQTLPKLAVHDSTRTTWQKGQKIEYQIQLSKASSGRRGARGEYRPFGLGGWHSPVRTRHPFPGSQR